nr:protein kinase PINOID-like [Tanacetum cinerariifolium]
MTSALRQELTWSVEACLWVCGSVGLLMRCIVVGDLRDGFVFCRGSDWFIGDDWFSSLNYGDSVLCGDWIGVVGCDVGVEDVDGDVLEGNVGMVVGLGVGQGLGITTTSESSSTMSSDSCTSFSRLSFDVLDLLPSTTENMNVKPHRSSESSWQAIKSMAIRRTSIEGVNDGGVTASLSFRDFSLVRQIGSGDIGKVYLCKLRGGGGGNNDFYAMKVVDKEVLVLKKKVERAATEKKILNMLDHPFLPSLYAQFDASHFSCVVMEYCCGGDLHSLRHNQPRKRFSLSAARSKKVNSFSATKRLFVAEPVAARSCSFVGTHEYVSPEVASGRSHGNAVDWWALGIFIYEMVYGCTPFAGASNEATLRNIVKKPLTFPTVSVSTREDTLKLSHLDARRVTLK